MSFIGSLGIFLCAFVLGAMYGGLKGEDIPLQCRDCKRKRRCRYLYIVHKQCTNKLED